MRVSWLILMVFVACGAGSERLTLSVGESRLIETATDAAIQVSRRGIIDAHPIAGGRIELTALRPGIVIVEGRDPITDQPIDPRLVLTVVPSGQDEPRLTTEVQLLEDSERQKIRDELRSLLGDKVAVTVSPDGTIVAETLCAPLSRTERQDFVTAAITGVVVNPHVQVICREHRTGRVYVIEAKLIASQTDASQMSGGTGGTTSTWRWAGMGDIQSTNNVVTSLAWSDVGAHGEVVGEPLLHLATGDTVEVSSGGEFQVVPYASSTRELNGSDGSHVAHWRRHGFSLKVTLLQGNDDDLLIKYDLALHSRPQTTAGGQPTIQSSHRMAGSLPLGAGQSGLAGSINVQGEAESTASAPGLSKLPIIGPLWRMTSDQTSASRLSLWLTVRAQD